MIQRQFKYHPNWPTKAKKTRRIQPWCANNPFHTHATIVHHLHYKRSLLRRLLGIFLLHNPFDVSVAGYEIPGWDIVPVCEVCHENYYGRSMNPSSLHNTRLWVQKGGLNNHQVWWKAYHLRFNFFILWVLRGCRNA